MVLVDIENVIRHACRTQAEAAEAHTLIDAVIGSRPGDVVVIGSDSSGLLDAVLGWGGPVRAVVGRNENGADLALLEVLAEDLEGRFAEVVLVSGDGIFAEALAALGAEGVSTTVVAYRASLSNRLRMAAGSVLYLPSPDTTEVRSIRPTPTGIITTLRTHVHKEAA